MVQSEAKATLRPTVGQIIVMSWYRVHAALEGLCLNEFQLHIRSGRSGWNVDKKWSLDLSLSLWLHHSRSVSPPQTSEDFSSHESSHGLAFGLYPKVTASGIRVRVNLRLTVSQYVLASSPRATRHFFFIRLVLHRKRLVIKVLLVGNNP
jgi:hypothetical protein